MLSKWTFFKNVQDEKAFWPRLYVISKFLQTWHEAHGTCSTNVNFLTWVNTLVIFVYIVFYVYCLTVTTSCNLTVLGMSLNAKFRFCSQECIIKACSGCLVAKRKSMILRRLSNEARTLWLTCATPETSTPPPVSSNFISVNSASPCSPVPFSTNSLSVQVSGMMSECGATLAWKLTRWRRCRYLFMLMWEKPIWDIYRCM